MHFFASCPKGLESLLANELKQLGATQTTETRAGVAFETTLKNSYRICLWSRLTNHIFLPLTTGTVENTDQLYQLAYQLLWHEHMTERNTFALDVDLINAPF